MNPRIASRLYTALFASVVLSYITACAAIGLVTPTTPAEKVAYAAGSIAAIQDTAAQAVTAKRISLAEAQQVRAITYNAGELTKAADALYLIGNTAAGDERMAAIHALLKQVQEYVAKATAAPPAPSNSTIH